MVKSKKKLLFVPLVIMVPIFVFLYFSPGILVNLLKNIERRAGGLTQHSAVVNQLHIEYLEGGSGDVIVLLHGFGADKDNWTRFSKFLTKKFKVIAPDLPGFGESSADLNLDYTIDSQVVRLKAFLTSLGIKTFHLGGSSMGGNIAGAYAAKYPQEIKSLLLIAPGGVASSDPSEMIQMLKEGKPHPLIARNTVEYDRLLGFVFYKKPFIPGPIKKHLMQFAVERKSLNATIFQQFFNQDDKRPLEELLINLPIPTLVVWGKNDRVLHVSGAKSIESVMPQAQIALMENMGHLPMIEKPKETAELYLRFLKGLTN